MSSADQARADRDRLAVAELLGREPQGDFDVVVRDTVGAPRVIRNSPLLDDGRPMPTLYWLVSSEDRLLVSRLESAGGVRMATDAVNADELAAAHEAYRAERDERLPTDWEGPRPSAGVGGTRVGIKCLHAHYAYWLAGGVDPVGEWVANALSEHPDGFIDGR